MSLMDWTVPFLCIAVFVLALTSFSNDLLPEGRGGADLHLEVSADEELARHFERLKIEELRRKTI